MPLRGLLLMITLALVVLLTGLVFGVFFAYNHGPSTCAVEL